MPQRFTCTKTNGSYNIHNCLIVIAPQGNEWLLSMAMALNLHYHFHLDDCVFFLGHSIRPRHSSVLPNWTEPTKPCSESPCPLDLSSVEWEWQSKPSCVRQFQQQFCDHAMYYIFSFNRYQRELTEHQAVTPFTPNFTFILLSALLLVSVSALIIVLLLLHRTEHLQVQDPLERSFLSSSIRNVLFRTLHDHHLRLLLPMAFFVGLEQGFFIADFNKVSKIKLNQTTDQCLLFGCICEC